MKKWSRKRRIRATPGPATLQEAIQFFTPDKAHDLVAKMRWPIAAVCPRVGCGSAAVTFMHKRNLWQCKDCRKQSSVKVGTIFEDSPISLDKWLIAMWMLGACRNGASSCEVARALGVTQKTAWFMLHRIRLAMKAKSIEAPLHGEVEADETFVGGRRNDTKDALRWGSGKIRLRGPSVGKTTVFGMAERGEPSQVRAQVVPNHRRVTLEPIVRANVEPGSHLYTDALRSYRILSDEYRHAFVDHTIRYVEGRVHTNTLENFWSCLKRTIKGTYIAPRGWHLDSYLDEQVFRFNNRELPDGARLEKALETIEGRRITYRELTRKEGIIPRRARRLSKA
jgi:transposase-like protein